ncbi:MAG TPA: GNAT family N-acetyltransferase [Thermoanaerobaculia bacterium]|nr:GNAT family N-acetyltransferase [Thermoanaerobaculia bacterium]
MTLIRPASAAEIAIVHQLLLEYAASLPVDLDFQDFDRELLSLPGDYSPPRGALLVAESGPGIVGCVAMRPLEGTACEMKRMFVRPEARGSGAGRLLAEEIIAAGRRAGYEVMRLDTLPTMVGALALYRALGFREIPPYRFNPVKGTIYLELRL